MSSKLGDFQTLVEELSKKKPNQNRVKAEMKRLQMPFKTEKLSQLNQVLWQMAHLTIEEEPVLKKSSPTKSK
jgi:hypothetical protein